MKRAIVVAALLAMCITGAAAAQDSTGDLRVLVIRATWGPTPDDLAQLSDAAPFYDRASFGQLRLHLDITPWLAAYSGPVCPSDGEAAKAAARSAGYDVAAYARVVYVIPEEVCDFRGVTRGNEILLAAPQALVHELGHTFGLGHASAYACAKPCRHLDEYGDPLSPMGHGTVDFSAYEKLQLGWISSVQRVDRSRTYAVADIDAASVAPQALVVPAAAGEYWIEHRSTGLVVRLVKAKRSIFLAQPRQRYTAPKLFSVTAGFAFTWLDRTRPTTPKLHGLDATVLWWTRSTDAGSGIANYRVTLDGNPLATTTGTNVTLPQLRGTHRLAVVASDRAGNRSRPGTVLLRFG